MTKKPAPTTRYQSLLQLLQRAAPHCPAALREEIAAALSAPSHRPRRVSLDDVLRLRAAGQTWAQIGEALGCTETYAARLAKSAGA